MKRLDRPININAMTRKVDVDQRLSLRYYYRIADNLLKQASIYREEKNIIDLYIILVRFSSLVSETIPFHRDYQALLPKEKSVYKRKLLGILEELESLKPDFKRQLNELNKVHTVAQLDGPECNSYGSTASMEWSSTKKPASLNFDTKQLYPASRNSSLSSWKLNHELAQIASSKPLQIVDKQFQKLSFNLPLPKEETLSRHSILGPNGLRGQWLGPSMGIKVNYPSNAEITPAVKSGLNQGGQYDLVVKESDPGARSTIEAVLSLDDGRWLQPHEEPHSSLNDDITEDPFQLSNIRQPSPPPVLAHVQQDFLPIPPSKVADPRPGPAKPLQDEKDGISNSNSYQHLHIKNRVFHITTLIIPKQESTSDSCQTMNEEEIFDVQDKLSLFPLGWIHTHPSQTCFMSSVDLHTHYSYQIMLPEAIAIVMAPKDTSRQHGIFHLSDPGGVSVIRNCQQRGFHPHEEPEDGSPIYEHCSHVYMNSNLKFDVVDLR
ncbi:PREDICTED: AMSH-like ubiquitin thioesterase 3 isoform X2 [Nelumbo nucifera]|uniref:AMSH-like ubiquitin thioesterase 3 isoform X2 n=1 Tax=Nelumbo nucifera TaxID=4432 RepID=A0A1U8ABA8_NELNU|nr:PREDICTED: AMSH-like ubiquitin thioesterase 3 isoform X2 [Nelumbo nucifera]